jgi:conjugal transfer pilin signal peptidase TrbI
MTTWLKSKKRIAIKMLAVALVMVSASAFTVTRYGIGLTPGGVAPVSCIKDFYRVWLIDKTVSHPEKRGELWSATGIDVKPIILPRQTVVKYVWGLPGDTVEIHAKGISVNDQYIDSYPLTMEGLESADLSRFERTITLASDEYFLMGDTAVSFDSRYWGPVNGSQLIGRTKGIIR